MQLTTGAVFGLSSAANPAAINKHLRIDYCDARLTSTRIFIVIISILYSISLDILAKGKCSLEI